MCMLFHSRDKDSALPTGKWTLLPVVASPSHLAAMHILVLGEGGSNGDNDATPHGNEEGGANNERGSGNEGGSSDRDANPLEPFLALDENRRLQGRDGRKLSERFGF